MGREGYAPELQQTQICNWIAELQPKRLSWPGGWNLNNFEFKYYTVETNIGENSGETNTIRGHIARLCCTNKQNELVFCLWNFISSLSSSSVQSYHLGRVQHAWCHKWNANIQRTNEFTPWVSTYECMHIPAGWVPGLRRPIRSDPAYRSCDFYT